MAVNGFGPHVAHGDATGGATGGATGSTFTTGPTGTQVQAIIECAKNVDSKNFKYFINFTSRKHCYEGGNSPPRKTLGID